MKIVTWNVNSIRVRLERTLAWLREHEPDVLCLQELKAQDSDFPVSDFEALGYHTAIHGQKTYNGVAILSRDPATEIRIGIDDGEEDPQARLISAKIAGVHVFSAYFPNGGKVDSDKYIYKLKWMTRLRALLDRSFSPDQDIALCGDFNVAPGPLDLSNSEDWTQTAMATDAVRQGLSEIQDFGFTDTYRQLHPEGESFSWWDYRRLAFPKNKGLRIDHIYATASLAARCREVHVDRDERKKRPWDAKGKSTASDHAPVVGVFE